METLSIILGTLCIILFLLLKGVTKMRDNDFEDMTNIILSYKSKKGVSVGDHSKKDVKYHALKTAIVAMLKENRKLAEDIGKKDFHIEQLLTTWASKQDKPKEPTKVYPRTFLHTASPFTCKIHNCTIGGLVCQKCPELVEYGTYDATDSKFIRCKRISEALPTLKYRADV